MKRNCTLNFLPLRSGWAGTLLLCRHLWDARLLRDSNQWFWNDRNRGQRQTPRTNENGYDNGNLQQRSRSERLRSTIVVQSLLKHCQVQLLLERVIRHSLPQCRCRRRSMCLRSRWRADSFSCRYKYPAIHSDDQSWGHSYCRCYNALFSVVWRSCMSHRTWICRPRGFGCLGDDCSHSGRISSKIWWRCFDTSRWSQAMMSSHRTIFQSSRVTHLIINFKTCCFKEGWVTFTHSSQLEAGCLH